MPTYEYECTACGHRMEVFQRLADDPLTECERCGGRLRKLFHPVGISFKGSGFYTTDSRSRAKKKEKKPAAEPSTDGKAKKDAPSKDSKSKDSKKGSPKPSSAA